MTAQERQALGMYEFGQNWAEYASSISSVHLSNAEEDFKRLFQDIDLKGKTFVDIGSGSGVHSLAALRGGVEHLTALDIDLNSNATTKKTLEENWQDKNYKILNASILDDQTLKGETFDIVYSWGVLHHTGDMWGAIENAAQKVKKDGIFVLAIYKKSPFCGAWKVEKRIYSSLPKLLQYPLDWLYGFAQIMGLAVKGRNPVKYIKSYREKRGMKWMTDIRDWLGGYPYESASPQEIKSFLDGEGFELIREFNTRPCPAFGLLGSGCAEYVLKKVN